MFGSTVLNVVIGLVFIYLLYSLLASVVQELYASITGMRSIILQKGISRMLDDDAKANEVSKLFYNHPLIKFLGENNSSKKPAYLTAQNFSKVFIDLLRGDKAEPGQDFAKLINQSLFEGKVQWDPLQKPPPAEHEVNPMPDPEGKPEETPEAEGTQTSAAKSPTATKAIIGDQTLSYLRSVWADSQGDVEKFRNSLEQWFDDTMERASGWYKKKTQWILLTIGMVLAIAFNVDSISIAEKLSHDPKLAAQFADNAQVYIQTHKELATQLSENQHKNPPTSPGNTVQAQNSAKEKADKAVVDQMKKMIDNSNNLMDSANALIHGSIADANQLLGLGWSCKCKNGVCAICFCKNFHWYSVIGWMMTALALSLGAPFWFDLLNKLMKLRSSVATSPPDDKNQKDPKNQKINPAG